MQQPQQQPQPQPQPQPLYQHSDYNSDIKQILEALKESAVLGSNIQERREVKAKLETETDQDNFFNHLREARRQLEILKEKPENKEDSSRKKAIEDAIEAAKTAQGKIATALNFSQQKRAEIARNVNPDPITLIGQPQAVKTGFVQFATKTIGLFGGREPGEKITGLFSSIKSGEAYIHVGSTPNGETSLTVSGNHNKGLSWEEKNFGLVTAAINAYGIEGNVKLPGFDIDKFLESKAGIDKNGRTVSRDYYKQYTDLITKLSEAGLKVEDRCLDALGKKGFDPDRIKADQGYDKEVARVRALQQNNPAAVSRSTALPNPAPGLPQVPAPAAVITPTPTKN